MPAILPRLTLVLGGARSGKSQYAEGLITALPSPWTYIATAEARDAEMADRIAVHQARRAEGWVTREVTHDLAGLVMDQTKPQPVLIDCLTLWLTTILLAERDIGAETERLLAAFDAAPGPIVAVSNEVGLGIVPDNALARAFRDAQGRLNAAVAQRAGYVVLMAAGLPLTLKQT